jgi:hypothetical protein
MLVPYSTSTSFSKTIRIFCIVVRFSPTKDLKNVGRLNSSRTFFPHRKFRTALPEKTKTWRRFFLPKRVVSKKAHYGRDDARDSRP